MNSRRDIRRRIQSIIATAQITKAMQMVAGSKMRRAQQSVLMATPFARTLYRIQRHATTRAVDFTHPLLEVRDVRRRAVIVVSSDKGLCGALNTNLFRMVAAFDPQSTIFITAGRRAAQFIARTGRTLEAEFSYGDSPRFPEARAIALMARDLYLQKRVDEVRVVFTRFVNTLTQEPVSVEFLPIGAIHGIKIPTMESEELFTMDKSDCLFEPNASALLAYLLRIYLNISMYFILLHAKASEQSARMVSMKNATDNAESLIRDLTLASNKMRQAAITTELLEIAGGQAH